MKKSNILIAVFSVIVMAASVVKAQEFKIDFDGALKPQTMHDIFANSHQFIPAGADTITPVPVLTIDNERPQRLYNALAAYYIAQPKIKALVVGYYLGKGNAAAAAKLSDKTTRVLTANGSVFVIHNGRQELIEDPALAASVEATAYPNGQQKLWGLIVGGAELIDAATNDAAWNAVGDAVSAITEAATSNNYNDPNDTSDHNCVSQGTC